MQRLNCPKTCLVAFLCKTDIDSLCYCILHTEAVTSTSGDHSWARDGWHRMKFKSEVQRDTHGLRLGLATGRNVTLGKSS